MNVLTEANELVAGDRNADYGHPADDFARTAAIWSAVLGTPVSAAQVGLCMIGVKLSRETHRHKIDNLIDIAGYAQTVAMVRDHEETNGNCLVYLASPYTHADAEMRELRFQAACLQTAEMIRDGTNVFSPIVHSVPLAKLGLPSRWADWEEYDRAMLERCSELAVLELPGWEDSAGVQAEIRFARELGIPVRHIEPVDGDVSLPFSQSAEELAS